MNRPSGVSTAFVSTGNKGSPAFDALDARILPGDIAQQIRRVERARPSGETSTLYQQTVSETAEAHQREPALQVLWPIFPVSDADIQSSFVALQEWEGVVTNVGDGKFTGRLVDLTHSGPDEEAEFSVDELDQDDRPLVVPGAYFRWSAGVLTMRGGSKLATSQVIFRRLPKWIKRDLDRADGIARQLMQQLALSADDEARSGE
jgi:hypothetical protein